jgi:hypothetical protein
MGRLEIIGFANLPNDNATYSEEKEYVKKSAEEIEKILRDLGLRDYSKDFTSTPGLHVIIYLDKADKNCRLYLYLNTKHFYISFKYHLDYLTIDFDNDDGIWIARREYFLDILNNCFHSIRNFREEIFKYLEECYQNGSVNLKNFTEFFLKNCRNFVEEGKKEFDKVKEILDRNKKIVEEKIGDLDIRDFMNLVIRVEGRIKIDSQKKVFILGDLTGYDEERRTLSKIERLLKYGKFKEGLDEIPFVRRLKEIKQKLEKEGFLYSFDIRFRGYGGLIVPIDEKL